MAISARHQLLSDSWTVDVEDLEWAIGRFKADPNAANSCEVVFFENDMIRHIRDMVFAARV